MIGENLWMNISTTKLSKKIGESLIILLVNGQNVRMKILHTQKQPMAALISGTMLVCNQNIKC